MPFDFPLPTSFSSGNDNPFVKAITQIFVDEVDTSLNPPGYTKLLAAVTNKKYYPFFLDAYHHTESIVKETESIAKEINERRRLILELVKQQKTSGDEEQAKAFLLDVNTLPKTHKKFLNKDGFIFGQRPLEALIDSLDRLDSQDALIYKLINDAAKAGANINSKIHTTKYGQITPLDYAVKTDNTSLAVALLNSDQGHCANKWDRYGITPLMQASSPAMAAVLRKHTSHSWYGTIGLRLARNIGLGLGIVGAGAAVVYTTATITPLLPLAGLLIVGFGLWRLMASTAIDLAHQSHSAWKNWDSIKKPINPAVVVAPNLEAESLSRLPHTSASYAAQQPA
jgi:hypothetical protein